MSLRAQKYYRSNWVIAGVFVTSIGNSVDTLLLPAPSILRGRITFISKSFGGLVYMDVFGCCYHYVLTLWLINFLQMRKPGREFHLAFVQLCGLSASVVLTAE